MKTTLFYLIFFSTITMYSQTQIGANIGGEAENDLSGYSVSLSSGGNFIAIGAPLNDNNGINSGHVRVYENMSGIWTQIGANIEGEAADDRFGQGVSLSSNGNIVAIGAPLNDGNGVNSGHARVYQNISGVWTQIGSDINGEAADDRFGQFLSLSSNGNTLAIGATLNDDNGSNSGHTRIYENISGVWTQIGADIDGEAAGDNAGYGLSLSGDGNVVAIGARINKGNGSHSGHVRVYQNISSVWTQIGADIDGEAVGDLSGFSVSISDNGSIVAIGAVENDGNGYNSGHVRVYQNLSGVWTQIGSDINGEASNDRFGWSVSLSSDGSILAIGAYENDANGTDAGHVRIYENISGVWTQMGTDIDGETAGDGFGTCVSLSSDGSSIAIGAPTNDGNGNNSGNVRVFDLSALLNLASNEISKKITVFPNPVNNQLHLQFPSTLEFKIAAIYNYQCQLVLQSKTTTINLSNLSSGVYFIEVETNKGKGVKKIVKK